VGTVLVNGELWRAEAETALPAGTPVKVTAVEKFTLTVKSTAESE
jgi:membrane protein implicated in regulation of membrane protease activity